MSTETEHRTYHVECSTKDGSYRVVEYSAGGDRWIVVASGLMLAEALRRCRAFAARIARATDAAAGDVPD